MIEDNNKEKKNEDLEMEIKTDDEKEEIENNGNKMSFFIKPPLSFHLSESTKIYFTNFS